MGSRKWKLGGPSYLDERTKRISQFLGNVGGIEEISKLSIMFPYRLLGLGQECLERVKYLPVFPSERSRSKWLGNVKYQASESFVRKYVDEALALSEEVVNAGWRGDWLEFLKKSFSNIEWGLRASETPEFSPLHNAAMRLNNAVRTLCYRDFKDFTDIIHKCIFDSVMAGSAESVEFSQSIEDFVVGVVAKLKAEAAKETDQFGGVKMPQMTAVQAEQAVALFHQINQLIDANPSIVGVILPQFSELSERVEQHRPASTERTLNAHQAAKRIGISHVQVIRLIDKGRFGERDAEGKPVVSEQECDAYRKLVRKKGRPPKSDASS